jgi:hypothetical protein
LHGSFILTQKALRSLLVGLGVGLEVRRTSGENEVLLENLGADVRSEVSQKRYNPKPESTVQSVIGDFIFTKTSHSSCFPYSIIVLVEI